MYKDKHLSNGYNYNNIKYNKIYIKWKGKLDNGTEFFFSDIPFKGTNIDVLRLPCGPP